MGADLDTPAAVSTENRYRVGLTFKNPLAGNPGEPRFFKSVRRADGSELKLACPKTTRLALALMNMHAVHGGAACHWGGPSAFAEAMSAIHGLMFTAPDWRLAYNFINDAGHTENGIYALKANYGYAGLQLKDLKGFRSIDSKLTGHGESHLFGEGVMVSNGPLGSSLPIAQGLAMADRVADSDRVTICTISDGAMMEGEAKEALSAIPGLAGKDQCNPFVLVISDNDTKLSGRITEQAFSMQPSFKSLQAQGWNLVEIDDGHDLQRVFTAVEDAVTAAKAERQRPVALWLHTIKGKGVQKTEQSSSGGHGYPLKSAAEARAFAEEINGGPLDEPWSSWVDELEALHRDAEAKKKQSGSGSGGGKTNKVQAGFPEAMIKAAAAGKPVISISADLQGSTGVAPFHAAFPQFSFDVGVAEANMISTASGFSKQGYVPVVDTFVQFGVTKGNLPLVMGILSQAPTLAVFTHCGFQDAADGASHQGLYYIAATASIPHLCQYCPATAEEAEWAMTQAIDDFVASRERGEHPDGVIFFCGRENFPVSLKPEGARYEWGRAMRLRDTSAEHPQAVVISVVGYLATYAMQAVDLLAAEGIGAIVLQNSTPNRPDLAGHQAALEQTGGKLITVEDHQALGGAGQILTAQLAAAGTDFDVEILGVQGAFGQSAYNAIELYDMHGIGPKGIVEAGKRLV